MARTVTIKIPVTRIRGMAVQTVSSVGEPKV
jgi:hypothetical protein